MSALRQGRGVFWQRLSLFFLICFTGLPPFYFFFNKLGLLVYIFQTGSLFRGILVLFFLLFGWYVYFVVIRWLGLGQVAVGYSRALVDGLFAKKTTQLWVLFFFLGGGLVFLLDDFFILVSWFFF